MSRRDGTTTKVFIGSLPAAVNPEDLRKLFSPYGKIVECDIANRCGFLHLEDKDLAEKAIEDLNNTTFMGGRISVEKGRVKPPKSRRRERDDERGGRDRGGPYSRDDDYGRGSRNGLGGGYGGGRDFDYDRYGGYDRGAPPLRGYDDFPDRRPMYDDRARDYLDARRDPYASNGYGRGYDDRMGYPESRGGYPDSRGGYPDRGFSDSRGGYDDRRMASYSAMFDDRRAPVSEPRAMIDSASSRPTAYDRAAPSNDMYSRRGDSAPKPTSGYGGDRNQSYGSYGSGAVGGDSYASTGGYGATAASAGYGSTGNTGGYGSGTGTSSYGTGYDGGASTGGMQNVGQSTGGAGYGSGTAGAYSSGGAGTYGSGGAGGYNSSGAYGTGSGSYASGGAGYSSGGGTYGSGTAASGGYGGSAPGTDSYGTTGGQSSYDDGYGASRGAYDTSYAAQPRSLSSGGGGVRDRERDSCRSIPLGPERRY